MCDFGKRVLNSGPYVERNRPLFLAVIWNVFAQRAPVSCCLSGGNCHVTLVVSSLSYMGLEPVTAVSWLPKIWVSGPRISEKKITETADGRFCWDRRQRLHTKSCLQALHWFGLKQLWPTTSSKRNNEGIIWSLPLCHIHFHRHLEETLSCEWQESIVRVQDIWIPHTFEFLTHIWIPDISHVEDPNIPAILLYMNKCMH